MIRKIFFSFLITLIFFISPSRLYAMGAPPPHKYIPLRILVVKPAKEVNLRIKGAYRIVDFDSGEVLREGKRLQNLSVSEKDIDSRGIRILPEKRTRLYINDRQFRGELDIIKDKDTRLLVVNHIDLEEYLYGVLYHEISHRWPTEVLKAQAIAARTYALYQKLVSKNEYYDLTSDIYSQVYGGRTSEKWRTTQAVNLTRGYILTYSGKVFPAYFHATCGGHTTDANTIWNMDVPVLKGRTCDFCKTSPHYNWKKELAMDDIQKSLREAGHDIHVSSFEILKRDESGRVLDIMLKGKDKSLKLSGNKFRLMVGPNIIKSTNLEVIVRGRYVTFQGRGWGHGVGMCQWGAYDMSRRGCKVEDILEYYYPGAEIARLD